MDPQDMNVALGKLTKAGYEVPQDIARILATAEAATSMAAARSAAQAALRAAMIAGDDLAADRAADALVASKGRGAVAADILAVGRQAALDAWPVAETWAFAASRFDVAATEFHAAMRACDPDEGAASLVCAAKQKREAWASVPTLVKDLDVASEALIAAAQFALPRFVRTNPQHVLGLLTPGAPSEMTDELCVAWENRGHGRGGRWAALVRVGAKLKAASLEDYKSLELPESKDERTFSYPTGVAVPSGAQESLKSFVRTMTGA